MVIGLIQKTIYIMHPFIVRILNHLSGSVIRFLTEVIAHELFCKINNLKQAFFTILIQMLQCCINRHAECLSLY